MATVAFEHGALGSAFDELELLGDEFWLDILAHCQKLQTGKLNYRWHKLFFDYKGVEMFHAAIGERFVIYAVEPEPGGGMTVTIMFAGRHGRQAKCGFSVWNGYDYKKLRTEVLLPRAQVWFD